MVENSFLFVATDVLPLVQLGVISFFVGFTLLFYCFLTNHGPPIDILAQQRREEYERAEQQRRDLYVRQEQVLREARRSWVKMQQEKHDLETGKMESIRECFLTGQTETLSLKTLRKFSNHLMKTDHIRRFEREDYLNRLSRYFDTLRRLNSEGPLECGICYQGREQLIKLSPCGHETCHGCRQRLTHCPYCRHKLKA